jgi:hypothetical protein
VDKSSGVRNGHVNSASLDRRLLAQGDEKLWTARYDEAETLYRRCLNYHDMPEPRLRLALCCLYKGRPDLAIHWVTEPIQRVLWRDEGAEPDPVEWAYSIVALLCLGKVHDAVARANRFQTLCHPELARIRAVIRLVSEQAPENIASDQPISYRFSVHQLPERKMEAWLDELCKMLRACRQDDIANRLARSAVTWNPAPSLVGPNQSLPQKPSSCPAASSGSRKSRKARRGLRRDVARAKITDCLARAKFRLGKILKMAALPPLQKIELRVGYFLPYKWSLIKDDAAVSPIRQLLRAEDIKSGLLIGAADGRGSTEAFIEGLRENPNGPLAVCMNFPTPRFIKLQKRFVTSALVECRCICEEWDWHEHRGEAFDAVVIDGSEVVSNIAFKHYNGARLIILDDINASQTFNFCRTLLTDDNYAPLHYDPSHRGGYAVFARVESKSETFSSTLRLPLTTQYSK